MAGKDDPEVTEPHASLRLPEKRGPGDDVEVTEPHPRRAIEDLLRERTKIDGELQKYQQKKLAVVFTDIKGSTKYFEAHGDVAGRAMIQRHNDLLFPVVTEHGGKIVKTIGDSIMAFFDSAERAVRAAMEMQRRMARANKSWPVAEQIHIRIGVHAGVALVEGDDIYGDTVNTAARVEACAEPDEVLISEATRFELGESAPPTDHRGQMRLHGKSIPTRLFSVRWWDREHLGVRLSRGWRRKSIERQIALIAGAVLVTVAAGTASRWLPHLQRRSEPPAPAVVAPSAVVAPPRAPPASPPPVASHQVPEARPDPAPPSRPEPRGDASRAHEKAAAPAVPPPPRPPPAGPMAPGTLHLSVYPWADVYVDGALVRPGARAVDLSLTPGRHAIRAVNPRLAARELTVDIASGHTETRELQLSAQ